MSKVLQYLVTEVARTPAEATQKELGRATTPLVWPGSGATLDCS
jgi:hypothetical protein